MKKWLVSLMLVALGLSLVATVGLGSGNANLKGSIAIVLDVGGRGDLSFNDMGFKGTDQAAKDFGLKMVTIQSSTAADYLPNIRNAARSGKYDLILCVGFLLGDALNTVAQQYPDQKFAIIDSVVNQPNVMSIVFRENESSALVGALGAMVAAYYGYPYVGVVLGMEIPVLYHFEAGYRFGIDWGNKRYAEVMGKNPNVGLLWTYTGTFSDIAKGKSSTQAMLAQGAGLVYNVAGPLGLGDLQAISDYLQAKGKQAGPPFMIGVDADQDWMGNGNKVLASAMKRVDVGCYDAVKSVVDGTFKGGVVSMGLSNLGVAISRYSDLIDFINFGIQGKAIKASDKDTIVKNWLAMRSGIPYWIWDSVCELETKIMSGEIVVPTANTLAQIKAIRAQYPLTRK